MQCIVKGNRSAASACSRYLHHGKVIGSQTNVFRRDVLPLFSFMGPPEEVDKLLEENAREAGCKPPPKKATDICDNSIDYKAAGA